MLPEELKTYIDKCLADRVPLDGVETGLRNAGWAENLISEAKTYYTNKIIDPAAVPAKPLTETVVSQPEKKRPAAGKFIAAGIIGLLLFLTAGGAGAYFVATEKIPLANTALKKQISRAVFSVPFVPKPVKYMLTETTEAHQKLFKNSFEVSAAFKSNDWKELLGNNVFEVRVKGYMDLSNSKIPRFTATAEMDQLFAGQIIKNGQMSYVKVDKIPAVIYTFLPITPEVMTDLLTNWIAIDNTPLDTEAMASLESDTEGTEYGINKQTQEIIEQLMDEDILPQIKITTEEVDGFATNKFTFVPTMSELDRIAKKYFIEYNPGATMDDTLLPSNSLSEFSMTVWTDKKMSYVRKVEMKAKTKNGLITTPDLLSGSLTNNFVPDMTMNQAEVAIVIKLSDFGKEMEIKTPKESITLEEFFSQLTGPRLTDGIISSAADKAMIQTNLLQIETAIRMYQASNNKRLPTNLNLLVPDYLSSMEVVNTTKTGYKVNRAGSKFLIHTLIPDSSQTAKPFAGIETGMNLKYYSLDELEVWGN